MSTFPDGLFQYGGAPVGMPYFPALKKGAKVFFVDPAIGSDTASGLTPTAALDTVEAAYNKTTDKAGDIVVLLGDGSTTGTARDNAIVWSNSNTHLIGVTAPTPNQRARIAPPSTSTVDVDAYTPYITVSGSGCIFANFSLFQGQSESKASIGMTISGNQNYFYNLSVITGAHANGGDAAEETIRLQGDENVFEKCYIGGDTWARSTTNYVLRLGDGSSADEVQRNIFRSCVFTMWADNAAPLFVANTGLTDIQRWNLFENCSFINTGTSTLTAGVSVPGSSTGRLFFQNCGFFGVTDVTAADNTLVQLLGPTPGTPVDCGLFKSVDIS